MRTKLCVVVELATQYSDTESSDAAATATTKSRQPTCRALAKALSIDQNMLQSSLCSKILARDLDTSIYILDEEHIFFYFLDEALLRLWGEGIYISYINCNHVQCKLGFPYLK